MRVGSDNALKGGQVSTLAKMIPHPNYTASDWDWDVALLKLKKNIKFNKKAKAIKVSDTLPKSKSTGVITGWGSKNYVSNLLVIISINNKLVTLMEYKLVTSIFNCELTMYRSGKFQPSVTKLNFSYEKNI